MAAKPSRLEGGEALEARDERERGFGMDDAMARADVVVENADSLEAFHDRIRAIIEDGVSNADLESEADPTDEPTEAHNP